MPRKPLPDLSVVLTFLREGQGWSQADLGRAAGTSPSLLNDYEGGRKKLTRQRLEHLISFMGLRPERIDATLTCLEANRADSRALSDPADRSAESRRHVEAVAGRAGRLATDFARSVLSLLTLEGEGLYERQRADFLWTRLKRRSPDERLALVEDSKKFRSWALCERVAAESIEAAAEDPAKALELAGLALRIAELAPGEEGWRRRLQGYAGAFVANAHRVNGNLPGAAKAFSRASKLWEAGAPGDSGLLNEAWIPWIEAYLCGEQQRLPMALKRIDDALAADRGHLRAKILLTKSRILEIQGNLEASTAILREAASLIDVDRDSRSALGVRFQLLVNLCLQDGATEAEQWLGEVRELAGRFGKELDLVRMVWLEGSVWTGVGRTAEAIAAFEQVRREFANRGIAFDYALVSLELSLVLLDQGRTEEVRKIADEMLWIFRNQKVHREALAALQVFCDAAKREAATAKLARSVFLFLHRAQHDSELRFEAGKEAETP